MTTQAALLEESAFLNARIVSLPRLQVLGVLSVYDRDGMEFRELQAHMGMSDGKLLSNLYALRDLGMIHEEKTHMENKTLTTYRMTDDGRHEWDRTRSWLRAWVGTE